MSYTSTALSGDALDRWLSESSGGCYGRELDDCIRAGQGKPYAIENAADTGYESCSRLRAAYDEDFASADQAVRAMPYCPSSTALTLKTAVMVGIPAILLGLVIGLVVAGKVTVYGVRPHPHHWHRY